MSRSRVARGYFVWLAIAAAGCASDAGRRSELDRPIAGITVNAPCKNQRCAEGLICHYGIEGGAESNRCVLEPGRCRDAWDCANSVQRCRRFGTRLGVCQDTGL